MKVIPAAAHNQLGACGQQSHLAKQTFRAIRQFLPLTWTDNMILALVCAAHNSSPLSHHGCAPLFVITGRSTPVEERECKLERDGENDHSVFSERMRAMMLARKRIMEEDAKYISQVVQRSKLRTGAKDTFQLGDLIITWMPKEKGGHQDHGFWPASAETYWWEKG